MSYIKKTLLLFIILWIFHPCGIAQSESSEKKKLSLKPFYTVEANFGISTCMDVKYSYSHSNIIYMVKEDATAKLKYKTLVYGISFVGGIEFAHFFKAGLGLGYLYYKQRDYSLPHVLHYWLPETYPYGRTTHGIPLFLNLRSDFLDKKTTPFLEFKIGNNFLVTKETVYVYNKDGYLSVSNYGKFRLKNGLFLATNLGIAFKTCSKAVINLSVGYRLLSRDSEMQFIDKYDVNSKNPFKMKYSKTGYTIADHQFIVNFGVSFNKKQTLNL